MACLGDGKWPNLITVCRVCKGRGVLPDSRLRNPECPVCIGTGKFPNLISVCPTCQGWGRLADDPTASSPSLSPIEASIQLALEAVLPSAAASYRQAILDLHDPSRQSMRGTAAELREALRELLDHLASDSDVMKMVGFKPEPGQAKPTMRQKAQFVLQAHRTPGAMSKASEDAASVVDAKSAALVRSVYRGGSFVAHVGSARVDVRKLKMYVDTVLAELLDVHKDP